MKKKTRLLVSTVVFSVIVLSSCIAIQPSIRKVSLSSWPSYGKNSGFYLALERGHYSSRDVDFRLIDSLQNALLPLETGDAEVAQVLCSAALAAIEQGADYRIIAIRDAVLPVGTISLTSSGIKTPSDYERKRWGHSETFSPERALLPALAQNTGFDPNTVRLIHLEFPARLPALLKGEVDFISAWWGSGYPPQLIAARKQNIELDFIRWSDYDIDIYGECLVARNDWLKSSPSVARAFLEATQQGFEEAMTDPNSAIKAVIAQNPDQVGQEEVIALAWEQSQDLINDEQTMTHGLFWIDEAKLSNTRKLILGLATKVPIERTYTNEFLSQDRK